MRYEVRIEVAPKWSRYWARQLLATFKTEPEARYCMRAACAMRALAGCTLGIVRVDPEPFLARAFQRAA